MRIVHIVPTYLPATRYGGPIYSVHGLCRGLAAAGHDVTVYTTSVDGPHDSDVPHGRPVLMDGVKVMYFRSSHARRLYWAPSMRVALIDGLRRADVVHLHSVFLWPTNMAARLAVRAAVPYVLAPRGMLVRELIRQKSRWVKTLWLRLIEAYTLRHAARLHFTSEIERAQAAQLYPVLPPASVVPNGVDLPAERDDALPADAALRDAVQRGPFCLFLGRVHWVKGIDRLLRAVAGTGIRVLICGNDEEGYLEIVRGLIRSLHLEPNVALFAPVHGADKWRLLSRARMLVLPSMSENFGNVIPEAMSVGCPVVATSGVGASELVRLARAGLVCPPEDEALRDALKQLWSDDALRDRMAASAFAYARDHLTWAAVARQMVDCYTRAVQSRDA
jgi:glycosyltransferase involved in cell wall biosynthesis